MKKALTLLAVLVTTLLFGQDLKLEHLNSYWWSKTNYFTPCQGYDNTPDLIRLEYRITNLSDSVIIFPDYTIALNTCRGTKEVNELITIRVEDKNGNVVHQHNDGIAVKDDGLYYFFVSSGGCWEGQAGATQFQNIGQIGLSPGHFHVTNAFPSGMQLGFSPNYIPYTDTFKVITHLNAAYIDRGADCAPDTTRKWLFIDKENKKATEVDEPQIQFKMSVQECPDQSSPTSASIDEKTRTLKINGSNCTTKYVARYIDFGAGQILADDGFQKQWVFTFEGNEWIDNTALNQKDLQAYAAIYPGVSRKGKPSYYYKIYDAINLFPNNALIVKRINYTQ